MFAGSPINLSSPPATFSNIGPGTLKTTSILNFPNGGQVLTAANLQILSDAAAQLTIQVPSNGTINFKFNGATLLGVASAVSAAALQFSSDGTILSLNTPTGGALRQYCNGVLQTQMGLGGVTYFGSGLGTVVAANIQLLSDAANNLTANVPTGGVFNFKINNVVGAQIGFGGFTSLPASASTLTAANYQIMTRADPALALQVPTGATLDFYVNAVEQMSHGLGGIVAFGSGLGTVTAGNIQLLSDGDNNLTLNVPTGGQFAVKVNNVAAISIASALLTSTVPISLSATAATTAGNYQIGQNSNTMYLNVPTGKTLVFDVNAVVQMTLGLGGITAFGDNLGTITAANIQILSASSHELTFNVPTGGDYGFKVNNVYQFGLGLGGITLFGSGFGTITATNIQILSAASNVLTTNVPTGGSIVSSINAVAQLTVAASLITSVSPIYFSTVVAPTAGNYMIGQNTNIMYLNVPTGKSIYFEISATLVVSIAASALTTAYPVIFSAAVAVTAGSSMIGVNSYLYLNAVTGQSVQLMVNGVAVQTVAGASITNAQPLILSGTSSPTSAGTAGTAGQLAWDSTNFYICTATGGAGSATWKKLVLQAD